MEDYRNCSVFCGVPQLRAQFLRVNRGQFRCFFCVFCVFSLHGFSLSYQWHCLQCFDTVDWASGRASGCKTE